MDRFISGWLSGLVAGALMNMWSFFSFHILNFTKYRIVDWTGGIIFGKLPENLTEIIVALILNLLFAGFLGSISAMILFHIGSDYLYVKGIIIATIFTFVFLSAPTLFQEPMFKSMDVNSVISNYIGSIIWGLTVSGSLKWIDKNYSIKM